MNFNTIYEATLETELEKEKWELTLENKTTHILEILKGSRFYDIGVIISRVQRELEERKINSIL